MPGGPSARHTFQRADDSVISCHLKLLHDRLQAAVGAVSASLEEVESSPPNRCSRFQRTDACSLAHQRCNGVAACPRQLRKQLMLRICLQSALHQVAKRHRLRMEALPLSKNSQQRAPEQTAQVVCL